MEHAAADSPPGELPDAWCTVVVPCYNEAARLKPELFLRYLATVERVRFLFVNDGSRDATLAVLESLRAREPERIFVMDQQPNRGKAEAVRAGMLRAIEMDADGVTGFWDADLATPLVAIEQLLRHLRNKPTLAMVFGSRVRLLGHFIHRKPVRHYLGRTFATVVSLILHLPIYDTQCGAKLFRITPEFRQILAKPFQSRWIFDVEILARYLALHDSEPDHGSSAIYESALPSWEDVAGSKVGPLDFVRAFYELWKIHATYRHSLRRDRPGSSPN